MSIKTQMAVLLTFMFVFLAGNVVVGVFLSSSIKAEKAEMEKNKLTAISFETYFSPMVSDEVLDKHTEVILRRANQYVNQFTLDGATVSWKRSPKSEFRPPASRDERYVFTVTLRQPPQN